MVLENMNISKMRSTRNENWIGSSPTVQEITNKLIRYARGFFINETDMMCPDCDHYPVDPVTGRCGHTRCLKCVQSTKRCPCGLRVPPEVKVNVLIRTLLTTIPDNISVRGQIVFTPPVSSDEDTAEPSCCVGPIRRARAVKFRLNSSQLSTTKAGIQAAPKPMTTKEHLLRGRLLVQASKHREAIGHLARAASSGDVTARSSKSLLMKAVMGMCNGSDPRRFLRDMYRAIREYAPVFNRQDLDCIICACPYRVPVSTPCGHTYCRTCIEKTLNHRRSCPLCVTPLNNLWSLVPIETDFIQAAMKSVGIVPTPPMFDADLIPILSCTVAFPGSPCPLYVFDPRYWDLIRRVLESDSKHLGIVAFKYRSYCNFGTMVKVHEATHLEDGRYILNTVGVSRFKIIERHVRDGCNMARVEVLSDVIPDESSMRLLHEIAFQVSYKAVIWLESMKISFREMIEVTFGAMPDFNNDEFWWQTPDGPIWLWWVIAILPLSPEIKVMILSTTSLLKRFLAVHRTLESLESIHGSPAAAPDCDLSGYLSSA